jgi:hypothetical protein
MELVGIGFSNINSELTLPIINEGVHIQWY